MGEEEMEDDSENTKNSQIVTSELLRNKNLIDEVRNNLLADSNLNEIIEHCRDSINRLNFRGLIPTLKNQLDPLAKFKGSNQSFLTDGLNGILRNSNVFQNRVNFDHLTGAFNNLKYQNFQQVSSSVLMALDTYNKILDQNVIRQELQIEDPEIDYMQHGIVDAEGRPLDQGSSDKEIITEIHSVEKELSGRMKKEPEKIKELHWREFEELIAEILEKRGYKVQLTPQTDDGGVDIIAAEKKDIGSLLYLVECKHWTKSGPIGPKTVRELFGVVNKEGANAGIITTTSRFTEGAKEEAKDSSPYRMKLRNYQDIKKWLQEL